MTSRVVFQLVLFQVRRHHVEQDTLVLCAGRESALVLVCGHLATLDGCVRMKKAEDKTAHPILVSDLGSERGGCADPPNAMPAILTSQDEIDTWLTGLAEVAVQIQCPYT